MLADYIKANRMAAGRSQKDVADALGYSSAQFVSNWERGLSKPPPHVIPKLAPIIKVDYADMKRVYIEAVVSKAEFDIEKKFRRIKAA